ncbi:MAG: ATP-binding protein [Clostridium sp.]|nr:ATP-binding protein [Acetatifactor muris]MCM1563865.1 ATP-binding protein [Clostridium sp.]
MIFLSGIHGVGKTFFCNLVKEELGIKSYSASQLIAEKRNKGFRADKFVSDIDDNQLLLIEAIDELRQSQEEFILDGHFCLLDACGKVTRIPYNTFELLKPDAIILLTEKPDIIAERRFQRDNIIQDICEIREFQETETQYAQEVSQNFGVPLQISQGVNDLGHIIDFIKAGGF